MKKSTKNKKTSLKTSRVSCQNKKSDIKTKSKVKKKREFPEKFPFWARFRVNKNRTTLVIDEEIINDKKSGKPVEGFVHREATHTAKKDYEKVYPNQDKDDPKAMYLKRPTKHPKREFEPHNKNLDMPKQFVERYEKNNKKKS